ncbi:uncharacterized protein TRIADDRAFT_55277 [Trichoplax adhaerens]|uniref:EF-hand domain-containing protein n=1 Tax=Trichoplax adhaerens TaxID=10228 RepID=B3RUG2_TRIAD|nr:predicted protein [Trichoplax adhaerens]EDV25808.1 predicted protein [Trichoplax adhaerens]|eukprot:XP_002111841.1 predicted protein [Trichoplax adhaerens]
MPIRSSGQRITSETVEPQGVKRASIGSLLSDSIPTDFEMDIADDGNISPYFLNNHDLWSGPPRSYYDELLLEKSDTVEPRNIYSPTHLNQVDPYKDKEWEIIAKLCDVEYILTGKEGHMKKWSDLIHINHKITAEERRRRKLQAAKERILLNRKYKKHIMNERKTKDSSSECDYVDSDLSSVESFDSDVSIPQDIIQESKFISRKAGILEGSVGLAAAPVAVKKNRGRRPERGNCDSIKRRRRYFYRLWLSVEPDKESEEEQKEKSPVADEGEDQNTELPTQASVPTVSLSDIPLVESSSGNRMWLNKAYNGDLVSDFIPEKKVIPKPFQKPINDRINYRRRNTISRSFPNLQAIPERRISQLQNENNKQEDELESTISTHHFQEEISDPLHDISLALAKHPLGHDKTDHNVSEGHSESISANKISILEAIKSHQLYEQSLEVEVESSYISHEDGPDYQVNTTEMGEKVPTQRATSRVDSKLSDSKSSLNNSDFNLSELFLSQDSVTLKEELEVIGQKFIDGSPDESKESSIIIREQHKDSIDLNKVRDRRLSSIRPRQPSVASESVEKRLSLDYWVIVADSAESQTNDEDENHVDVDEIQDILKQYEALYTEQSKNMETDAIKSISERSTEKKRDMQKRTASEDSFRTSIVKKESPVIRQQKSESDIKVSNYRKYTESSLSQSSVLSLAELASEGGNSSESSYVRVVDSATRKESSVSFDGEEILSAVEEIVDNFVERDAMMPSQEVADIGSASREGSPATEEAISRETFTEKVKLRKSNRKTGSAAERRNAKIRERKQKHLAYIKARSKSIIKEAKAEQHLFAKNLDPSIDILNYFHLVNKKNIHVYAAAFALHDRDEDGYIAAETIGSALKMIPTLSSVTHSQLTYVLKVLEMERLSEIDFKLFCVCAALRMFYCNNDDNGYYIPADTLRIELKAGGLSKAQENYIINSMLPNEENLISFINYAAYLPLFFVLHHKICNEPLASLSSDYLHQINPVEIHAARYFKPRIPPAEIYIKEKLIKPLIVTNTENRQNFLNPGEPNESGKHSVLLEIMTGSFDYNSYIESSSEDDNDEDD